MTHRLLLATLALFFSIPTFAAETYDLVIYGGTSAGVAAALQARRMGKTVLIIEPTHRLGGLTSGGLGQTDIGNKAAIGGISREFYQRVKKHYEDPANWKWQKREQYKDGGQTTTASHEDTMWTFEPSAALKVFNDLVKENDIPVLYAQRLRISDPRVAGAPQVPVTINRALGVTKQDTRITAIHLESGKTVS